MRDLNKNRFIFPVFLLIISVAFYAIVHLAPLVKPATLDDADSWFSIPAFPAPVSQK